MTSNETTTTRTIHHMERMPSSRNGNPRFRIYFTDGTHAPTAPDSGLAYAIENREYRDVPVAVTVNGRGWVTEVTA